MKKWLIPCNVKHFNLIEYLKNDKVLFFKKNRDLAEGDIVYLYVAQPYGEILYSGKVIDSKVKYDDIQGFSSVANDKNKLYVKVSIEKEFSSGTLKYAELKSHGLGQVVNQQLIRGDIEEYITSKE